MPSSEIPDVETGDDETLWLVSFADDDDRELRPPEIAEALTRGEIDRDTIVWREGMPEWVAIADVPSLARLLPASGNTQGAPAVLPAILATGLPVRGESTSRKSDPPPLPRKPPAAEPASEQEPVSVDPESLSPASMQALAGPIIPDARAEQAAEPSGADEPPATDQDDEEEPPSSGTPSLGTLTSVSPPQDEDRYAELLKPTSERPNYEPPSINVGDLPNATVADDYSPESERRPSRSKTDPPAARSSAPPQRTRAEQTREDKGRSFLPIALIAIAIGVGVWFAAKQKADVPQAAEPEQPPAVPARATAEQLHSPPVKVEPGASAGPTDSAEPSSSAEPPEPPTAAEPVAAPTPERGTPTTGRAQAPAPAAPSPAKAAQPPDKPASTEKAEAEKTAEPGKEPEATEPEKEAPAAPPFNKDAAIAALNGVASQASACRKEGDPTGKAHVRVTFSTSGRATRALVTGPPFAGTKTGGCIAATMRRARVPAFSGAWVTVSKTVVIR